MRQAESTQRRTARGRLERIWAWALEHPVLFVIIVALVARVLAAIVLTATVGVRQFPDSVGYDGLASDLASGAYRNWSSGHEFYYDHQSGYVLPLAVLYWTFGDHMFLGQMLAGVFGALTAGVVCRLALEVAAARWAVLGGLIVALLPSQVLWSSVVLRDSAVWLVTALIALVAVWASRAHGWRLAGWGASVAGLLFWMGHLRLPTFIVASWALVLAACFSLRSGRLTRLLGALAISAIIPWYVGTGAYGIDHARAYPPGEVRVGNAADADTGFVDEGDAGGVRQDLLYLPRGLSVMLLEPFPWSSFSGYEVRLAQSELLLWYPLLILAGAGIPMLVRERRKFAFMGGMTGMMLIVYALYEGNFGTAFRHRSELVPGLTVLAAVGTPATLAWWRRKSQVRASAAAGGAR